MACQIQSDPKSWKYKNEVYYLIVKGFSTVLIYKQNRIVLAESVLTCFSNTSALVNEIQWF